MLGLGHYGPEGELDPGHPEIHAALSAAAVYRGHSQAFANLSMHEQRLYRILREASKSLEEMKAKRIAARQTALDAARELHNLNKMQGLPDLQNSDAATSGFVFTAEEIEAESRRQRRLLEAKIARDCDYDPKKFSRRLAAALTFLLSHSCSFACIRGPNRHRRRPCKGI
jgi:hypothetical protein